MATSTGQALPEEADRFMFTNPQNRAFLPPRWRSFWFWVCIVLFSIYILAIFLDLPFPAGEKYAEDVSPMVFQNWGGTPNPTGLHADHWWYKIQALRGWSLYPEGWYWPKIPPAPLGRWILVICLGLFSGIGIYWLERRRKQGLQYNPLFALAALITIGFFLQLGTLWLKSSNPEQLLLDRITDRNFTGYFSSAYQISNGAAFFSEYTQTIVSPEYCLHCRTHPPGPVLFYWLLLKEVGSLPAKFQQSLANILISMLNLQQSALPPAALIVAILAGNFILLIAAGIVLPLYGLANLVAGKGIALPLAALGVVLPGLILMSPEFDQVYGTFAAVLFYLAFRGLNAPKNHQWWGFCTGILFSVCLYGSFGLWYLSVPLVLFALFAYSGTLQIPDLNRASQRVKLPFKAVIAWLLGLFVGTTLPWVIIWIFGRFPLWEILRIVGKEHLEGITTIRPYFPWLVFNLVGFLQFVGLPIVLMTILNVCWRRSQSCGGRTRKRIAFWLEPGRLRSWISQFPAEINPFSILFWGIVLALDLSGTTRAEVERLWIFISPLALLAIYYAAGLGRIKGYQIQALLTMQFAICVTIGGNWLTP
jgi:hypothetical protein